jgi:voltage-gated sodium channel
MSAGGAVAARNRGNVDEETGKAAVQQELDLRSAVLKYEQRRPNPANYQGLLRSYVVLGDTMYNSILKQSWFSMISMLVILLASVLVGVQTYDSMESVGWVVALDNVILVLFSIEIVIKLISESVRPYVFFYGNPNNAWNIFDLIVVIMCLPFMPVGSSVAVLRLARLARIARVGKIIQKLTKLRILIRGIVGGCKSIAHTGVLIMLMVYMFAVMGCFFFSDNDPFHFGNLFRAVCSMLRIATLDNWNLILWINYFGCDEYHGEVYVMNKTAAPLEQMYCSDPSPKPLMATAFFVTYSCLSSMIMLSMFVGAITLSMSSGVEQIRQQAIDAQRRKRLERMKAKLRGKSLRAVRQRKYGEIRSRTYIVLLPSRTPSTPPIASPTNQQHLQHLQPNQPTNQRTDARNAQPTPDCTTTTTIAGGEDQVGKCSLDSTACISSPKRSTRWNAAHANAFHRYALLSIDMLYSSAYSSLVFPTSLSLLQPSTEPTPS